MGKTFRMPRGGGVTEDLPSLGVEAKILDQRSAKRSLFPVKFRDALRWDQKQGERQGDASQAGRDSRPEHIWW